MSRRVLRLLIALLMASLSSAAAAPKPERIRTWVDVSGEHSTIAKFVEVKDGRVRLLKTNGKTISLAPDQLSEADRQYVEQRIAELQKAAAEPPKSTAPKAEPTAGAGTTQKAAAEGPPKKGKAWSSVNDVEINGEKHRPGKRFAIWPAEDEPLTVNGGKLVLRLHWQSASDQMPPVDPENDLVMLNIVLVSRMARLIRGKTVRLNAGATQGEIERSESVDIDPRGAETYIYFSHDAIDAVRKKLVSTPLSNIIRIKTVGK